MVHIHEERQAIKLPYRGRSWATKVNRMTDSQVHAIYIRFKREGKI
jgi:hypothetical protein